ncbi:MAG: M48 family metalloprotease [Vicinamibacterales bacterium]
MRHTSKKAGTGLSLRLFRLSRSAVLWHLSVALTAINAYGQTSMLSTPQELLATDPRGFAEWLETARPKPVSAQNKARILGTLPPEGEITTLNEAARRKLAALSQLFRATERDSVYEIKVVESPFARTGLYERTVVLISETALELMEAADLQALMAHEIAHEYIWTQRERASRLRDYYRLKELELLSDAIAIVILHGLGLDPSRLMATVEKLTRYNRKVLGVTIDESGYPTLSERREFARRVTAWVARASPPRSSR